MKYFNNLGRSHQQRSSNLNHSQPIQTPSLTPKNPIQSHQQPLSMSIQNKTHQNGTMHNLTGITNVGAGCILK